MLEKVIKRKYAYVGEYFALLSIGYHQANIARVGPGIVAGRLLALLSEGDLSTASSGIPLYIINPLTHDFF